MKGFKLVIAFLLVVSFSNAYPMQEADLDAFTKHTVEKGQNVYQIARIYGASPHEVMRINPTAEDGIEVGQVLKIPKSVKSLLEIEKSKELEKKLSLKPTESTPLSTEGRHVVKPKETVYGLSKQYGLTLKEMVDANPHLAYGLKIGQVLTIPVPGSESAVEESTKKPVVVSKKEEVKKEVVKSTPVKAVKRKVSGDFIEHVVEAKETKWSISKKYGVTVQDIEDNNPEADILSIGEIVMIPSKGTVSKKASTKVEEVKKLESKKEAPKKEVIKEKASSMAPKKTTPKKELVKAAVKEVKKTKAPVAKKVVATPKQNNSFLGQETLGSFEEDELVLPNRSKLYDNIVNRPVYGDLLDSINTDVKKELVLLLPFNLAKIKRDSTNTFKAQLKKNRFLNMTLDYYSGALMAIDSASSLGLNINVRVIDSEESKSNLNMAQVIAEHDFSNVDAIIGPFKKSNIKVATEVLSRYEVPIISPLSKESSKLIYPNLYNSIPPKDVLRKALLDYLHTEESNVVAIVDSKDARTKNYLIQNYEEVRFAGLNKESLIDTTSISDLLVRNKMNVVVLETKRPSLILNTIEYLIEQKALGYEVTLATMDKNAAFDNQEIPLDKLVKLNLLYPSVTREDGFRNQSGFAIKYKQENMVFPNQYAIRGFDLTFDCILRLAQNISFNETISKYETEYVENRFSYDRDLNGGYFNRGVYVLKYGEDFTIKKVK